MDAQGRELRRGWTRAGWSALAVAVVLAACSSAQPQPGTEAEPEVASADSLRSVMDSLRSELLAEVGEAEASDESLCRVMPVGAKPCGGPAFFLVYSVQTADSARLAVLAEAYTGANRALNEEEGRISDCRVETPPTVVWHEGRCIGQR